MDFISILSKEFQIRIQQAEAAVELLDAGNTIPFIARYRKEATGGLDDQLLRELSERLEYLRSLDKRRSEIEKALKTPLCEVTEVYRTHSYLKGKRLLILPHGGEKYGGEYVGIDENGALVIRKENGELVTLFSGDVSVKPDI